MIDQNNVATVSKVRVDDHKIQIIGDETSLAAVIVGQQTVGGQVTGFVHKWCPKIGCEMRECLGLGNRHPQFPWDSSGTI